MDASWPEQPRQSARATSPKRSCVQDVANMLTSPFPKDCRRAAAGGAARVAARAIGFREEYRVGQAVDESRAELAVALDAARVGARGGIAFGIAETEVVERVVANGKAIGAAIRRVAQT